MGGGLMRLPQCLLSCPTAVPNLFPATGDKWAICPRGPQKAATKACSTVPAPSTASGSCEPHPAGDSHGPSIPQTPAPLPSHVCSPRSCPLPLTWTLPKESEVLPVGQLGLCKPHTDLGQARWGPGPAGAVRAWLSEPLVTAVQTGFGCSCPRWGLLETRLRVTARPLVAYCGEVDIWGIRHPAQALPVPHPAAP